jgi:hypothetical protein
LVRFNDLVNSIKDHGCKASRCKIRIRVEYFDSEGVLLLTGGEYGLTGEEEKGLAGGLAVDDGFGVFCLGC